MKDVFVDVLDDGPRNLVVNLTGYVSANDYETFVKKIDVSALSKWYDKRVSSLTLLREKCSSDNVDVIIYWEGTPSRVLKVFPGNVSKDIIHFRYGGISNNAINPTGNVLLSTENFTDPSLDGRYDITLWFKKNYSEYGSEGEIPSPPIGTQYTISPSISSSGSMSASLVQTSTSTAGVPIGLLLSLTYAA